jgi:diadenosine tetraphosphate (Ap4A) HIT family hydrolase
MYFSELNSCLAVIQGETCALVMIHPLQQPLDALILCFGIDEMSSWNDHDRWAALCSGLSCPICRGNEPLDLVVTLEASWVTMQEAAPVRGYACLVSRTHAVELHDLPEATACAFMRDARRVSGALAAATGAVKLNYEIHGNSLPHLHMHFFPRYRGDCFKGQPVNPRLVVQPVYAPEEFQKIRDAFLGALRRLGNLASSTG